MDAREAFTSSELAALLAVSRQAVEKRAKRESWQGRPRKARGGGSEWLLAFMPKATLNAIVAAQLSEQGVSLPALTACNAPASDPRKEAILRMGDLSQLTAPLRETALARLAFVREIQRQVRMGRGKESAIRDLEKFAKAGTLGERLSQLIPVANAKYGEGEQRALSRRCLY